MNECWNHWMKGCSPIRVHNELANQVFCPNITLIRKSFQDNAFPTENFTFLLGLSSLSVYFHFCFLFLEMVIKLKNGHKAKENVMFLNLNWKRDEFGNSLVVQWLELCFHCQLQGLSPGWGTEIPQAVRCGQKIKRIYAFMFPYIFQL